MRPRRCPGGGRVVIETGGVHFDEDFLQGHLHSRLPSASGFLQKGSSINNDYPIMDVRPFSGAAAKTKSRCRKVQYVASMPIKKKDIPEEFRTDHSAIALWECRLQFLRAAVNDPEIRLGDSLYKEVPRPTRMLWTELGLPKPGYSGSWTPEQGAAYKRYIREEARLGLSCAGRFEELVVP